MKNRTLTVGVLTAASLGLGLAAASGAVAHPGGHGGGASAGQGVAAQDGPAVHPGRRGARGRPGPRGRRGAAACVIADDRLLTTGDNARLEALKERLDERVADGDITRERADRIFARRQKMITVKVVRKTALLQPVLDLVKVGSRKELRDAVKEAGGMRELLDARDLERSDLRDARRQGRRDARAAVRELCSSGEESTDTTESEPAA